MLKKASELNNSNSLSLLANIYLVGYTVPVNVTLGLQYLNKSVALKDVYGIETYAKIYKTGMFGIKKNISKSVEYYKMIVNESLAAKYELIYIKAI